MQDSDPRRILGVGPDLGLHQLQQAYRQRLRETDPDRVRGMDEAIVAAACRARRRVEIAFRLLTDPKSVTPAERSELAEEPPASNSEESPRSYFRALWLTMVLPGSGSWYGGGPLRGKLALLVFALASIFLLQVGHGRLMALPPTAHAAGRLQASLRVVSEVSGWFSSLLFLMAADAVLAVWAHNDSLKKPG